MSVVGLRLWGEDELQRVKLVTKGGKALTADEDVATLQNDGKAKYTKSAPFVAYC